MKFEEPDWEVEMAYYIHIKGFDPEKVRIAVILRWMYHGNLEPLAAEIKAGRPLDEAVLNMLMLMIVDDFEWRPPFQIVTRPRKRGRPKDPAKFIRDKMASLLYEAED